MYDEYQEFIDWKHSRPPEEKDDFLIHYGIKGQKWGVRNYQYAEGGYTPAGAERYWGGTGQGRRPGGAAAVNSIRARAARQRSTMPTRPTSPQNQNGKVALSDEEQARRRARTRRIIGIAAGVAVGAALGYAAYRGSTNLRDKMRSEIRRTMDADFSKLNTMNSKYWDSSDRKKYVELTKQHADFMANDVTRREAVAAKFYEKTGIRINLPQNRQKALAARAEQNRYANFIRDAESRGSLNRRISNARKELKSTQEKARHYNDIRNHFQEERYGEMHRQQWEKAVEQRRQMLNDLLAQRRSGSWQKTGVRHIAS